MKRTVQPQVNGWFPLGWNIWNIISTQLNDNIIYHIIYSTKRWWEVSSGGVCFTLSFGICAWIKLTWRCLNCVCVVFQLVACFKLCKETLEQDEPPTSSRKKELSSCPGQRSGVKRGAPAHSANIPRCEQGLTKTRGRAGFVKVGYKLKMQRVFWHSQQKWGLREIHLSRVPWHNYVLRLISRVRRLLAINEQTTPLFLAIIISIRTSSVVAEMPCGPVEILNRF